MKELSPAFLESVKKNFPADFLTLDPAELAAYGRDWTRDVDPAPSALVRPRTTDDVSRFLKLCTANAVAVVPSGGRTGLAGGAVAANGEVILSLERMKEMGPVDAVSQTVRVQAGAVTEAVHEHCAPHGLTWPVDFASKGSSQVGGNISTNAGGVRVIRYGLTRQWVLGLQVVLMDGTVLELNGALEKNNTGADLRQLFIGTEGTLGVITEATLKLTRLPGRTDVFFFGVDGIQSALRLLVDARRGPFQVQAFEYLTAKCLDLVCKVHGKRSPLQSASDAYVLLEVESASLVASGTDAAEESPEDAGAASEALFAWLEKVFESGLVSDGTLAQSSRESTELWSLREMISESLSATGMVHKNDIALPIAGLSAFLPEMEKFFSAAYPDLEVFVFGHLGDGNLHVNVLKPENMAREDFLKRCEPVDEKLFSIVRDHRGSVSAEHGIGLLKKPFLHFTRTPPELALLRSLKKAFDPKGLLNPGKILD